MPAGSKTHPTGAPLRLVLILSLLACADRLPSGDTAASAFSTADSLREDGQLLEALSRYRELRDSFAQTADSAGLWRSQLWWSDTHRRLGRTDSARTGLAEAMRLAAGNRSRVGWTRLMISFALERDGQLDSSYAEGIAALELARETNDRKLEAYAHDALGTAHSLRGRYREALTSDSTSLALRRQLGLSAAAIAQSLNEVGIGYRHLGRYTDAVRVYEEALEIHRRLDNQLGLAMVSYNLSNIRSATGDMEEAAELLHRSLRYSERLQNQRGMGFNHNGLASIYLRAGNHSAARSHAQQALRINRSTGLKYGEILALENLGRLDLAAGRSRQAGSALAAALSLADSAGFGRERVSVRAALAGVELARNRLQEALRLARAANIIADSLADPAAQFQALEAEGAVLEALRRGAALDSYMRAIDLLESWRGRLALGDLRMGVAEPRLSVYEGAIRLLLKNGRAGPAFAIAERARARLLLELMAERDVRAARSPEQELRMRLREHYEARNQVKDPDTRARLEREITDVTTRLAGLGQVASAYDTTGARHPGPRSAAEVRNALLTASNRALLTFFWGDSAVYGWWLTRDSIRGKALGPADSLADLVSFLRTAIERPVHDTLWRVVARRAYQRLVEPLTTGPVDQVLIIADGPLAHIPLETLIPADGAQPWGATQQILYAPSASVLAGLAQAAAGERWDRAMLAVGNPTRARGAVLAASAWRGGGNVPAPLPYAEREARDLGRLFQAGGADLLLGDDATAARWLAQDPERYRYLHFAAHAEVSDRRPERTHLVLADGALDLAAIRRLRLSAQLVTLSACETALGRRVRGEGVIGLPHAFLAAGAHAVLVTLWRIGDESAADFMREFYQHLHAGLPAAEALRAVRSRWIGGKGTTAHPSRWAPFVLVGGAGQ